MNWMMRRGKSKMLRRWTRLLSVCLFAGATMLTLPSCKAQRQSETTQPSINPEPTSVKADTAATIVWDEIRYEFGHITSGDTVYHTYTFTNTGEIDFKIHHVKPTCGCTTAEFSTGIIKPGEKGFVTIMFDSSHKTGHIQKSATVFGNTVPPGKILTFIAEIDPRP